MNPKGLGLEAGYTNVLGLLPIPTLGARIGGKNFGISAGFPYMGIDTGMGDKSQWNWNTPRSLWEHLYDKYHGIDRYQDDTMSEEELQALIDNMMQKAYAKHSKKQPNKKTALNAL